MISPKGAWWRVFHDSELDRLEPTVAVSNQTLKADEANYRAGAGDDRRGASRPVPDHRRRSDALAAIRAAGHRPWSTLEITGSHGRSTSGASVRRQIEQFGAAAQASDAELANAKLSAQSALGLAYVQLREADSSCAICSPTRSSSTSAFARNHAEPVQRRHHREIRRDHGAGATARGRRRRRSTPTSRGKQNEHAIAVLMGKPPVRSLGLAPRSAPSAIRLIRPVSTAVDAAGAPARHRRGRADDEGGERRHRRRGRQLLPRHLAERRVRLQSAIPS